MNKAEQATRGGCCKQEITPTNVGSSVCSSSYLPTGVGDLVFPDWLLNGSRRKIEILENMWSECTSRTKVEPLVQRFIHDSENPFWSALHLCVSSADYKDVAKRGTSTLAHRIMVTFSASIEHNFCQPHEIDHFLNEDNIMISAFATAFFQYNNGFYQLLYKTYRLFTRPALFASYVRQSIEDKHFDKACRFVATLCLHDMYSVADIVLPLYAQNKIMLVHDYLQDRKDQQIQFVEFLDRMCSRNAASANDVVSKHQIPNVVESMLKCKTLCKFVKKLAAKYQVPEKHWPEVLYSQTVSSLRYFMDQFYREKTIPVEDWEDMLVDFVTDKQQLQREAVFLMYSHMDLNHAVKFARKFNISADDEDLPYDVQDALRQGKDSAPTSNSCTARHVPLSHYGIDDEYDDYYDDEQELGYEDEYSDEDEGSDVVAAAATAVVPDEKFYVPNLPAGNIHIVGSKEEYERCIEDIAKIQCARRIVRFVMFLNSEISKCPYFFKKFNAKTVALDCEWRFLFVEKKIRLALIQLATEGRHVYLLDVLSLHEQLNGEHWGFLVDRVFKNPSIEKLGFSFHYDWKMLASVHTALMALSQLTINFTDIMTLCNNILSQKPQLFNHYKGVEPSGRSLSTFVEMCMGKPLDKTEQFSDWERRPLRPSQKLYAASDACSVLDIYESLKSNCTTRGIDLATFKGDEPRV